VRGDGTTVVDVMMDLETLGTRPGSAIRSVGAVVFDPHGDDLGDIFSRNITAMSCWIAGLAVDRATLDWWDKQSRDARDAARVDQRPLAEVVREFHAWLRGQGDPRSLRVWCHGANFDEPLWQCAAHASGEGGPPWSFWNVRCTRTLHATAGFNPKSIPREGVHHSAAADAAYQARCVQAAHRIIRDNAVAALSEGETATVGEVA
jgi:3' exoribonuclease, RNase T-like